MKTFWKTACVATVAMAVIFTSCSRTRNADEQGEITLRWASIWVGQDPRVRVVEALVEEYNAAHAGSVRVVVEPQPDANAYEEKIRTTLATGQAPADIFTIKFNPTTSVFYGSDLLMDFATINEDEWLSTFDQGALEQSKINGVLRSLPMETAIMPIWYNMDALANAGVDKIPETMDEMWDTFEKIKASGVAPTSQMTGDTNAWTSMIWFSYLAVSLGGTDVWTKPFTDGAFVQAADILKRIIADYSTPDAVGLGAGGSGGHFIAGRTAIFANGPWYAGRDDLVVVPFYNAIKIATLPPAGQTKNFIIRRLQSNICAAATDSQARRDAIIDFLKLLTSPETTKRMESSGAMYAIKTDYVPDNVLQKQFYELDASISTGALDLEAATGAEATREFAQQLSALVLDRITSQQFCELVNAKISR